MKGKGRDVNSGGRCQSLVTFIKKDRDSKPATGGILIGVLEGTGIGPEVMSSALSVLKAAAQVLKLKCEVRRGGLIGEDAVKEHGEWLPQDTMDFCANIFQQNGTILSGPGGGRYVYDLRRRFDLFCKFVPVKPIETLADAAKMLPEHLRGVDLLIVRDNTGGVYQGRWGDRATHDGRVSEHSFSYSEQEVQRLMEVAARASVARRGGLHVIVKDGGVPAITELWRDIGRAVGQRHNLDVAFMNVDLAAYEIIQNPARFDVIIAPNLFGDILADICGVLVSSRGVTFSGNFDASGHGVYQTNHGCAHDLAGRDMANPGGQILSIAMMLRESFGLHEAAELIESALSEAWREGYRTADIASAGCKLVGTKAMTERVVERVFHLAEARQPA